MSQGLEGSLAPASSKLFKRGQALLPNLEVFPVASFLSSGSIDFILLILHELKFQSDAAVWAVVESSEVSRIDVVLEVAWVPVIR